MIHFKLRQLIEQKEFAEHRNVMLKEICEVTGIHRASLNRMLHRKAHNFSCDIINLLCEYFECAVGDLMEYVPDTKPAIRTNMRGGPRDMSAVVRRRKSGALSGSRRK